MARGRRGYRAFGSDSGGTVGTGVMVRTGDAAGAELKRVPEAGTPEPYRTGIGCFEAAQGILGRNRGAEGRSPAEQCLDGKVEGWRLGGGGLCPVFGRQCLDGGVEG